MSIFLALYVIYLILVALTLLGLRHEGRVQLVPDGFIRFSIYCTLLIPGGLIVLVEVTSVRHWIYEGLRRVSGWGVYVYRSGQSYLDRVNRGSEGMPLVHTEPGKPDEYRPVQRENV